MSTNKNYYHNFQNIEKLKLEKEKLHAAYRSAIENDLKFEETKQIFLRLKEIKQLLESLPQRNPQ